MGLFSRRPRPAVTPEAETDGHLPVRDTDVPSDSRRDGDEYAATDTATDGRGTGPWDSAAAPTSPHGRIDLGSLHIPAINGMQVHLDAAGPQGQASVAILAVGGSTLELRAFAAPRSGGIWDEIRADISDELARSHISYRSVPGPYGPEVTTTVSASPGRGPQCVDVRFIGVDGPRWFLRAVVQGPAAREGDALTAMREILSDVVVVRDSQARPPREILPLRAPGEKSDSRPPDQTSILPVDPGPTIAEVR